MRALLALTLTLLCAPSWADSYEALYQAAGWPQQEVHFQQALKATREGYRSHLPQAVYDSLQHNAERRLGSVQIRQRMLNQLRQQLSSPAEALQFFSGPVGQRVVAQEIHASSPSELKRAQTGMPAMPASPVRQALVERLGRVLPVREAGAEVALALGSLAADSLSQMLPGLFDPAQTQNLVQTQRAALQRQMAGDLHNTLLYVYRELEDAELAAFAEFAESPAVRQYYAAALSSLKAGLAVGQTLP